MTTHFPTVPVAVAHAKSDSKDSERLPPLILVVDDEPLLAETMAEILKRKGLAVMTALDGLTALEIADVIPPQLLLSDITMPDLDGFTLAIEITRRIPDCEVILLSGQYSMSEPLATLHAEGRDFLTLTKPVHPITMLARVFERLSLHGWHVPVGFPPKPESPAAF